MAFIYGGLMLAWKSVKITSKVYNAVALCACSMVPRG